MWKKIATDKPEVEGLEAHEREMLRELISNHVDTMPSNGNGLPKDPIESSKMQDLMALYHKLSLPGVVPNPNDNPYEAPKHKWFPKDEESN